MARKRVSITVNARATGVNLMLPSVPQLPRSVRERELETRLTKESRKACF
jgi:hypothetical protein